MFRLGASDSGSLAIVIDDYVDVDNDHRDHRVFIVDSTCCIIAWLAGWIHVDCRMRIRSIIARGDLAIGCSDIWRVGRRCRGLSDIGPGIGVASRLSDCDCDRRCSAEYRGIVVCSGKTRKESDRGSCGELHIVVGY